MQLSVQEQLLRRNVKRFRGGLVCKAHRFLFHFTTQAIPGGVPSTVSGGRCVSCTVRYSSRSTNNYFADMSSGSHEGLYLRLVYHSALGSRVRRRREDPLCRTCKNTVSGNMLLHFKVNPRNLSTSGSAHNFVWS